jgi:hypothetical protein
MSKMYRAVLRFREKHYVLEVDFSSMKHVARSSASLSREELSPPRRLTSE